MANRRHSARRVKCLWTYNVAEAAKAVGATAGTVRHWHKIKGLEAVTGLWPPIFRGVDIIAFLKRRAAARKHPSGPGRIFCFHCKQPKVPANGEADYVPDGPKLGTLQGLCPDCVGIICRRTSLTKLPAAAGSLIVSMPRADSRLYGMAEPHCNPHYEGR